MKIIAVTKSTIILEASPEEVDRLAGKTFARDDHYYRPNQDAIGTEFAVMEAYDQIHRNKCRIDQVNNVLESIELIKAHLKMQIPFLKEPESETTPQEQK